MNPPVTPDGRYLVVRGRLWRRANPHLPEGERQALVNELMHARRAVGTALRVGDAEALKAARARVDAAKRALGERGPVWWDDGAPDLNRRMARNTPYADWWAGLADARHAGAERSEEPGTHDWAPSENRPGRTPSPGRGFRAQASGLPRNDEKLTPPAAPPARRRARRATGGSPPPPAPRR